MNLRTEEFLRRLADARAQWSEDGAVVLDYGSPTNEYWAVRDAGLGVIDRSERETLVIHGDDAITWLQGLVTSNLLELEKPGTGQRSTAVNHVGRTIADMRITHVLDMLLVDMEPGTLAKGFLGHLKRHVIMEKVSIEDRTEQTGRLTLTGEFAAELLADVSISNLPIASLNADYRATTAEIAGCGVIIQRIPLTGEPTFDLYIDREEMHTVWSALFAASTHARAVGERATEQLRLEAGVVRYGKEYTEKIIPIEADLNSTIDYDKGCYLGQEIIHRLDTRGRPAKMLRVLVPDDEGAKLEAGAKISSNQGKKAGEVEVVFESPRLDDRVFALAYVKRAAYELGERVTIQSGEGGEYLATVAALGEPSRM